MGSFVRSRFWLSRVSFAARGICVHGVRRALASGFFALLLLWSSESLAAPLQLTGAAKLLFEQVACGAPTAQNSKHCRLLTSYIERYRQSWLNVALPMLADLTPESLPSRVVYPFGGGDLLTALAVFPDATEVTTVSLEHSGDARTFATYDAKQQAKSLEVARKSLKLLFKVNHSKTLNLGGLSYAGIPGELLFSLVALQVHGYEPVELRYFHLDPQGVLTYVDEESVARADAECAGVALHKYNKRCLRHPTFAHMELSFRRSGDQSAPIKVFRHVQANLVDDKLAQDDRVLKFLQAQGRVAAMTKAASFLLWWNHFSKIRSYLLDHADWMISDATGIPPRYAQAAGFQQIPYGKFRGPFLSVGGPHNKAMRDLWQGSRGPLAFRFGYPDRSRNNHLLITSRLPGQGG